MKKIGYATASTEKAHKTSYQLASKYDLINLEKNPQVTVDVLLVLGGDGFMLYNIHKYIEREVPIYGINCGSIGFLLNTHQEGGNLYDIINNAYSVKLIPLKVCATDCNGGTYNTIAINELSVFRRTYQTSLIEVKINDVIQIDRLVGDGVLVSTAAGSSAYNFSAGGPILPINSGLITLTGINVFRPRRWKNALLRDNVKVSLKIIDPTIRPVIVAADQTSLYDIEEIKIYADKENCVTLLFDSKNSFERRIIAEQFLS